jgi:hypothetical protein
VGRHHRANHRRAALAREVEFETAQVRPPSAACCASPGCPQSAWSAFATRAVTADAALDQTGRSRPVR